MRENETESRKSWQRKVAFKPEGQLKVNLNMADMAAVGPSGLSEGTILKMLTDIEPGNEELKMPIVQILSLKKVDKDDKGYFYMLEISDGSRTFSVVKLGANLRELVDKKLLCEFAVVQLVDYLKGQQGDYRFILIVTKLVIHKKGSEVRRKLGQPQPFSQVDMLPWLERQYRNTHMKFDGSGENEPGLARVKMDITRLQIALQAMSDKLDIHGVIHKDMKTLIQNVILEYEQAKVLSCSNYKEMWSMIAEISQRYHTVFAVYFVNDKVWWRAYADAVFKVRSMLEQGQNHGYPGLPENATIPSKQDLVKYQSERFVPDVSALKLISSSIKEQQSELLHNLETLQDDEAEAKSKSNGTVQKCSICTGTFKGYSKEDLNKNGVSEKYPCTQPTLFNVTPKHEYKMEVVCSEKCDKIRYTKEVEILRYDGLKLQQSDLKWNLCQVCYAEKRLLTCGTCNMVYYCSRSCQEKHWPKHQKRCEALEKLNIVMTIKLNLKDPGKEDLEIFMDSFKNPGPF